MNKNKGVTLIELMVAVALFAIIAAIAAPNLRGFTERNRLSNHTNILVANLNLARSEAVKRNLTISACTSNTDQSACAATEWEDGWIVFIDTDSSGSLDAGETIIKVSDPIGGGLTIASDEFPDFITYSGDGSANFSGSFRVCDSNADTTTSKLVSISATGQVLTSTGTPSCP